MSSKYHLILLIGFVILFEYAVFPQRNLIKQEGQEFEKLWWGYHPANHESTANIPKKSFYKLKNNWQYIIDTTWGAGVNYNEKINIFNTYAKSLELEFDGFLSLQLNLNSWDSLQNSYLSKINDSTSQGRFSAIMTHFSMQLRDYHNYIFDDYIINTALNPGVPLLIIGGFTRSIEHFGAVLTALEDSNLLVLRTVQDHPLKLVPGDIVLGYEGIPWKNLVNELIDAEIPIYGRWGGAESAFLESKLLSAGLNWHLFDSIDVVKYESKDTVHLSVYPLLELQSNNMLNNEQLAVPGVLFPSVFKGQYASYGIIDNTEIGYIYLYLEWNPNSETQFYEAVSSLQETDGLIIDMRFNCGGWSLFNNSFDLLFNETIFTVEDAFRCDTTSFDLCPKNNAELFQIVAEESSFYNKPIALLLGPTCVSMGDITAQRLKFHPKLKVFGKPSAGSLGETRTIESLTNWTNKYSACDMFYSDQPGIFLNRKEFPIDYPIWFDADDVAEGIDTSVEYAKEWIDATNLSNKKQTLNNHYLEQNYPNPFASKTIIKYYLPVSREVKLSVYDITGKELSVLASGKQESGTHTEEWDGTRYSNGIYYCKLSTKKNVQLRKMVLIK